MLFLLIAAHGRDPHAEPSPRRCVSPQTLQPSFSVDVKLRHKFRSANDFLGVNAEGHLIRIVGSTGEASDVGAVPVALWSNSEILPLSESALLVLTDPSEQSVAAVDARDARLLWTAALGGKYWPISAAIRGRTAYVVTAIGPHSGGDLVAIDTKRGRVLWKVNLGEQFELRGSPSADDDGVVVWGTPRFGTDPLVMRSFRADGTERWSYRPPWTSLIAANEQAIFVGVPEGIRKISRADGHEGMLAGLPGVGLARIVVGDGTICYYEGQSSTERGLIGAVDMTSGKTVWQHENLEISELLMSDCAGVYGLTPEGDLLALAERTGDTIWRWSFGRSVTLARGPSDDSLLVVGADQLSVFVPRAAAAPPEKAIIHGRVRRVRCGKIARQRFSVCGKLVSSDARGRFNVKCTARGTIGIYDEPEGIVPAPGPVALVPLRGAHDYRTEFVTDHCLAGIDVE
jgi:outer membrane protein assembly factor BamB